MRYVVSILLLLLISPTYLLGAQRPFEPGEKLYYSVSWSKIKVADLTLEVAPIANVKGNQCWHFVMSGQTTGFVDLFYKVRDRVDAYTDLAMTRSIFYTKSTRGSKSKDERIEFNWGRYEATYFKNGKPRKPVRIQPGTFDPLSVFYVFRMKSLKLGQVIKVPVSDGKKCVIGQGRVVDRQSIKLGNKIYDCLLVIPDLKHIGGAFRHGREAAMKMWFTSDPRHIPVKIETKVKVGRFYLELRSFRKGTVPKKRLQPVSLITR